jgi:hypothetical protein
MRSIEIFAGIMLIVTALLLFVVVIPSFYHSFFTPYKAPETVLIDSADFTHARAVGVIVDNTTGDISFPTYYNWEMNGFHYEWVRYDGNFAYKSGEVQIRPNNLDGCWSLTGCK